VGLGVGVDGGAEGVGPGNEGDEAEGAGFGRGDLLGVPRFGAGAGACRGIGVAELLSNAGPEEPPPSRG